MKNPYKIAAIAIFALFFLVNILTLKDGHNWGDDFAQYIRHAVNLVEHKPYASDISHDLWVVYPPGFPLLLSSVIYWTGVNFKVLKSLNVLLWALSALTVYGLALILGLDLCWALMITVWFLTSPFFFFFKQEVLSDIPFMFFVLLSIWTLMKFEGYRKKGLKGTSLAFLWLSIFCMSYSLLVRWAGVSLFLAVILYFSLIKWDWKSSLGFILGALAAWLIALQCGSSAGGYFDKITVFGLTQWPLMFWNNLLYTLQTVLGLFISNENFSGQMITPSTFTLINDRWGLLFLNIMGFLFLGAMGAFLYRVYQRKAGFMGCFTFVYLIGTVLWPVHAGLRFLLPVMAPLAIYFVQWCGKPALRKLAGIVFMLLILQNIFIITSNFKYNDDDIFLKDSLGMVRWVKLHIRPEDNYMFSRPRALGLLTHRIGYSFWTSQEDMTDWYKRIKPLHIKYLIANKNMDQFGAYNNVSLQVKDYKLYINVVWENSLYKVFSVVPAGH